MKLAMENTFKNNEKILHVNEILLIFKQNIGSYFNSYYSLFGEFLSYN
jgi:hypothetical protein